MPIGHYETEGEYFARLKKRHGRELKAGLARGQYSVEELDPNGFFLIRDRQSGLTAVLNQDGTYRHGDLPDHIAEAVYEEWVNKTSEPLKLGG